MPERPERPERPELSQRQPSHARSQTRAFATIYQPRDVARHNGLFMRTRIPLLRIKSVVSRAEIHYNDRPLATLSNTYRQFHFNRRISTKLSKPLKDIYKSRLYHKHIRLFYNYLYLYNYILFFISMYVSYTYSYFTLLVIGDTIFHYFNVSVPFVSKSKYIHH